MSEGNSDPEPDPQPPTFSQRTLMYALIFVLTCAFIYWVCMREHR